MSFISEYPYHIEINTKREAADIIMHMCRDCDLKYICSGMESRKCNEVKESIVKSFTV